MSVCRVVCVLINMCCADGVYVCGSCVQSLEAHGMAFTRVGYVLCACTYVYMMCVCAHI